MCAVMAMLFTACKKTNSPAEDDRNNPPSQETNALPSKIVMSVAGVTKTYDFFYQAGTKKLDKIVESGGITERYEYDGDLIRKVDFGNNNYRSLTYANGKMTEEVFYRQGEPHKRNSLSYPSATKVTMEESTMEDGQWVKENTILLDLDASQNVVKASSATLGVVASMQFDAKNTPMMNIAGWEKTTFLGGIPLGNNIDIYDIVGRTNNPSKTSVVTDTDTVTIDYTYEFNDSDHPKFPTKISGTVMGKIFSATITYK